MKATRVKAALFGAMVALGLGGSLGLAPAPARAAEADNWWNCVNNAGVAGSWCPVSATYPMPVSGAYFYNVPSSVLTRANNTTAYSANQTVCAAISATPCVPLTLTLAGSPTGKGIINRVNLLKSGSATTNANFTVWLFSAAPGLTSPSQFDATAYSGPRSADMPNFIGSAACTNPIATSDTSPGVWYECALSNPNASKALVFQALAGVTTVNALVSVTAAYTPAAQETFTVYASGVY